MPKNGTRSKRVSVRNLSLLQYMHSLTGGLKSGAATGSNQLSYDLDLTADIKAAGTV